MFVHQFATLCVPREFSSYLGASCETVIDFLGCYEISCFFFLLLCFDGSFTNKDVQIDGLRKNNKTIWTRISWSTIFEVKLICTTFVFSNSYCIICKRTVVDGRRMRSCGSVKFLEGFKVFFLEKVKRKLKRR